MRRSLAALVLLAPGMAFADPAPVRIDGAVVRPQTLSFAQVEAFKPVQVEATFAGMHGPSHHVWTGASLWDLITAAGLVNAPGKNSNLRHTILVHGADGYSAALAIGEIDPSLEGKHVILATRRDGDDGELKAPALIVPGDKKPSRAVHEVTEIEVR